MSGLVLAWGVIMLALGSFSQYAARHARRRLADAAGVIKHQSEVIALQADRIRQLEGELKGLEQLL
jgi:hypothetical protein